MRVELGATVTCSDGVLGSLADVVVDPTARRLTHLLVDAGEEAGGARLVPVALASATGDRIALDCTRDEALALPSVHEHVYVRLGEVLLDDPEWDVGVQEVLALPSFDALGGLEPGPFEYEPRTAVGFDRIPKGEAEIRRESTVVSADGHRVGRVEQVVVDTKGGLTQIVVERGRLWRRRTLTIPVDAVTRVATDVVELRLTKAELATLGAARGRSSR